MVEVVFQNLEPSQLAREIVTDRMLEFAERFPKLRDHKIRFTLSMYNSRRQAGPDLFGVRVRITGGEFHNIVLDKRSPNLYVANSELFYALLEQLNRSSERRRTKNLKNAREVLRSNRERGEDEASRAVAS